MFESYSIYGAIPMKPAVNNLSTSSHILNIIVNVNFLGGCR